jgi:hypothetical protein
VPFQILLQFFVRKRTCFHPFAGFSGMPVKFNKDELVLRPCLRYRIAQMIAPFNEITHS